MKTKLTVAMPEMISKIAAGKKKFKITITNKITDEKTKALTGTLRLLLLPCFFEACPLFAKTNNVRLVLKIALLQADKAAVKTTKLMTPAAILMPMPLNT